ncbi:MAG: hypothetical protein FWD82_06605 [Defluviitaleaceae bacterium]|nr:hypothetical protein [Defluviitaleaceae bacterium]
MLLEELKSIISSLEQTLRAEEKIHEELSKTQQKLNALEEAKRKNLVALEAGRQKLEEFYKAESNKTNEMAKTYQNKEKELQAQFEKDKELYKNKIREQLNNLSNQAFSMIDEFGVEMESIKSSLKNNFSVDEDRTIREPIDMSSVINVDFSKKPQKNPDFSLEFNDISHDFKPQSHSFDDSLSDDEDSLRSMLTHLQKEREMLIEATR